jgi:CheY-like chemotaxis protein
MIPPSVLLVDDRTAVRQTLKSILASYNCDFADAADGETALALMASKSFDVIFLDLKLPDLSGVEILRRARERGETIGQVVVLTGFLEPEAKEESTKLGAFRHLTKDPINYDEVRDALVAALGNGSPPPTLPARGLSAEGTLPVPAGRDTSRQTRRRDSRPRILVLDDQVHWLDTIERVLGEDFAITMTTDPEEACSRARRARFDLIILDMNLSGDITGLDVLTRMAATTPDLKAIVLTGEPGGSYESAMESARRGARMLVMKNQLALLPDRVRQILNEPAVSPSVFLSYDRRDQLQVRRLYTRLKQRGLRPWMDIEDLAAGAAWSSSIEARIRESDHFVFCYSRHSWDKEGLIRKEVDLAIKRLPELREGRHYLIVARLDTTEVVETLRGFLYVDLFQRGGFDRLLRAISADAHKREGGTKHG